MIIVFIFPLCDRHCDKYFYTQSHLAFITYLRGSYFYDTHLKDEKTEA